MLMKFFKLIMHIYPIKLGPVELLAHRNQNNVHVQLLKILCLNETLLILVASGRMWFIV